MANSTERGGRKVSSLQPAGQGSGIAEVVQVRLPHGASLDAKTRTDGRRGFTPNNNKEVGIKIIRTATLTINHVPVF
jgi:hypothetical protein